MIFLTADLHAGHTNIIRFCNRPFSSVEEMDTALINNWNAKVTAEDKVYVLGDFAWKNPSNYLDRLNGTKMLLIGDHDKQIESGNISHRTDTHILSRLERISDPLLPVPEIVLCHWKLEVWPRSHYGSYHAYAHSHGTWRSTGKSHDVGVDCNNFSPISMIEFIKIMEKKPDNPNLVKNRHK